MLLQLRRLRRRRKQACQGRLLRAHRRRRSLAGAGQVHEIVLAAELRRFLHGLQIAGPGWRQADGRLPVHAEAAGAGPTDAMRSAADAGTGCAAAMGPPACPACFAMASCRRRTTGSDELVESPTAAAAAVRSGAARPAADLGASSGGDVPAAACLLRLEAERPCSCARPAVLVVSPPHKASSTAACETMEGLSAAAAAAAMSAAGRRFCCCNGVCCSSRLF